ncbi:FlgD immunoglobulin-like domain containing protein, partial [Caldithrix abyssi]
PQVIDQGASLVGEQSVIYDFKLFNNYPNPFNPSTMLAFEIPKAGQVRLVIYDLNGRLVKTVFDGRVAQGRHQIQWDGTNFNGNALPSGVYFARLIFDGKTRTQKLVLLK